MKLQKNYIIVVGALIFLGVFDNVIYSDFTQIQDYLGQYYDLFGNSFNQKNGSFDEQESKGLKILIKEDRDFKQKIQNNLPSLMDAVKNNHAVEVKNILQNMRKIMNNDQVKRFVDSLDAEGYAPLHRAAIENNYEIMKLLLEYDANPNVRCIRPENRVQGGKLSTLFDGCTSLHIIMQNPSRMNSANRECFGLMLEYLPNLKAKNFAGYSLPHVLIQSNNPNTIDFIKVLHAHGVDFNERDAHGQTLLDLLNRSQVKNKAKIINALMQAGVEKPMQQNNVKAAPLLKTAPLDVLNKSYSHPSRVETKPILDMKKNTNRLKRAA